MYQPDLQSIALHVPEIIGIEVLGGVANPQSQGRGCRRGSVRVPFERALVTSCTLSIVTFPLSLRLSEISSLLCSSITLSPMHPTLSPQNFSAFP